MKSRGPSPRGFTLVELMASMALGMVVLLVAVGLLGSTGDGYERIGGGLGAEREARALLNQLTSDFAAAQFHDDTLLDFGTQKWPTDRIGFLTLEPEDAQLDENRIGDLCAVRYYVKDETIGGKTVRCLMRGITESYPTFQALKNGSVAPLFKEPATATDSSSSSASNTDEAIAYGVVSFQARPKIRNTDGSLSDWTSPARPPDVMAIRVILARRELMGKLTAPADWNGDSPLAISQLGNLSDAIRNKNFQVYETTVRFGYHDPQ